MPRLTCELTRGQDPKIPSKIKPGFARHLGRDLIHLLFVLRGPRGDARVHRWPGRISNFKGSFLSPSFELILQLRSIAAIFLCQGRSDYGNEPDNEEKELRTHRVFLHNHSTWTDGHLSLNTIARLGEHLGASAAVMSEHDFDFTPTKVGDYVQACREASTVSGDIIPGIEYSSPDDDIHVVTMGTSRFHGARRDLPETLSSVRQEGGAAVLAHPRGRDSFNKISQDLVDVLDGIEIWNRKVDGLLPVNDYFGFAQNRG